MSEPAGWNTKKRSASSRPMMSFSVIGSAANSFASLENDVLKKDNDMKQMSDNVKREMDNAIDLPGLSHKLFTKYMNYIQSQVNITIKERPAYIPLSMKLRGQKEPIDEAKKDK